MWYFKPFLLKIFSRNMDQDYDFEYECRVSISNYIHVIAYIFVIVLFSIGCHGYQTIIFN